MTPTPNLYTPPLIPREHLSLSTLLSYARCPRRFFYQKCGIVTKDPAPALTYGLAMHKAFPLALTEGLDPAIEAFRSVWDEDLADERRNFSCALVSLRHFVRSHEGGRSLYTLVPPPEGIEPNEETSEWEIPFTIDIGLQIPLVGRIDALVQHRDTGKLWGLEFKTMSRLTSYVLDAFDMNPQLLTYMLALQTVVGQEVKGFLVEAMLVNKTKVESLTHPVYISENHIAEILLWLRALGSSLLEMEAQSQEEENPADPFLKDFSGCTAYPHFWIPSFRCEYGNLCRPPDWRQSLPLYNVNTEERKSGFELKTKGSRECPI